MALVWSLGPPPLARRAHRCSHSDNLTHSQTHLMKHLMKQHTSWGMMHCQWGCKTS